MVRRQTEKGGAHMRQDELASVFRTHSTHGNIYRNTKPGSCADVPFGVTIEKEVVTFSF